MASAIKTAGTDATTSLKALQWQPSSEVAAVGATGWITDVAAMSAYATLQGTGPTGYGSTTKFPIPRISNGVLYIEGYGQLKLQKGDWLVVDPISGWPIVIPNFAFTILNHVWQHS